MKLLIVSHPCVTPINQQFYAEVERQTGWDLTIVIPSNWKNEYGNKLTPERWPEYQGQLLSIPVWKSGDIPLHIYRSVFIPLLQKLKPDAIYVHHEPYGIATAQVYLANHLSLRRPIGFYSAQNTLKSYPPPFQQAERAVFQNSNFAFVVSHSVEQVLREKGCQENTTVLPLGIDPDIYFPHPQAQKVADDLRTNQQEILIGYLGRISEEKGLKTLLYALGQIQNLPWRLIVVGSGSYESEFDAIAQKLQLTHRVKRLGYIPHTEAPLYLSAFDLLVLPSETRPNWKEQFGRVIIEAIACGTPVVGSDSGEIPYVLQATGGGFTFPEAQPEALAEKLQQLILNPVLRSQLVEQGRQVVLQNYTNSSLAQRFAQTIEAVIVEDCASK
jgi:glycosyltransferase involved in cell wall biosynthesis